VVGHHKAVATTSSGPEKAASGGPLRPMRGVINIETWYHLIARVNVATPDQASRSA
jgi:hypothetical protein